MDADVCLARFGVRPVELRRPWWITARRFVPITVRGGVCRHTLWSGPSVAATGSAGVAPLTGGSGAPVCVSGT